jgi:hypothetical protein
MRLLLLCAAFCVVLEGPASAQGQPCPAFPVNTYTTGFQFAGAVSPDPDGGFLVVWSSDGQEGGFTDVFGQRFNAAGERQGPEFRVNSSTPFNQQEPSVARSASGNFVVVWGSLNPYGGGIFGQWFAASGDPLGVEFPVNETPGNLSAPSVAAASDGSFVVTWHTQAVPPGVYARRFNASGTPLGPEFRVNSAASDGQIPRMAGDPSGSFVVVWASNDQYGDGIFGRRYDAQGNPQGPEFRVNTYTIGTQTRPVVAVQANGDFAVVWSSLEQDGDSWGVFGQRYDAAGQSLGPELRVNTYTTGSQASAALAFDAYGNLLVTWGHQHVGFKRVVSAQRFGRSGAREGGEFRVSGLTDYEAHDAVVAASGNGFVVAWSGNRPGFDFHGVSASLDCARLYTLSPCRLADTRNPPGTPLGANTSRVFPVAGICNIPADARAVALNVTAVNPTDAGNLRVHPAGSAVPLASTLNFAPGRTRANNAIATLGTDGGLRVQCDMPVGSTGQTHLVLDVYGYLKR